MLALLFVPALLAGCAGPPRAIDRTWVASTAHDVDGFPSGKLPSYMALPVSPNFGLNPAKWPHPDSNISSSIWASDGTTSHGASCVPARFNLLNLLVTEKATLDGSTPLILSASHRPGVTSDTFSTNSPPRYTDLLFFNLAIYYEHSRQQNEQGSWESRYSGRAQGTGGALVVHGYRPSPPSARSFSRAFELAAKSKSYRSHRSLEALDAHKAIYLAFLRLLGVPAALGYIYTTGAAVHFMWAHSPTLCTSILAQCTVRGAGALAGPL